MFSRVGSGCGSLLIGLTLWMVPVAVQAQASQPTEDARAEAKARYERGVELYEEDNFRGALVEFNRCYELTGDYRVLFNVGQVCYQLQDYVCAVTSLEKYLRDGGSEVAADRRQSVQAEIDKLRARIATVTIESNVSGALLSVDDVPAGTTPLEPILMSAGAHRITLTHEGYLPLSQVITVAGSEKRTVKLNLVKAGGGKVVVREEIKEPESRWTTLSYVGLGAGGAMIAGSAITGVLALRSSSKMQKEQYVGAPSPEATDLQSDVETYRLTSDILAAAGVITLGTTLYLTLARDVGKEQPAPSKPEVGVLFGPGSAAVVGSF
jgi:hypothetical protein